MVHSSPVEIVVRSIRGDDLAACVPMLPGLPVYCAADLRAWQTMWAEIEDSGAGFGCVILDARDPRRYLGFGLAGFVTDGRAERMHALETAGVMRATTREYEAGGTPFLGVEQVGIANAGDGLNLAAISGFGEFSGDDEAQLMVALLEDFRARVAGFHVKSLFTECYREIFRTIAPTMMLPVREYSPDALRAAKIPAEHAPFVLSSRFDDTRFGETSFLISLYYEYTRPRFGFDLVEQRVLRLAVEGLTDEELGAVLAMSLAIVKKRLRGIYEKVADAPGLPLISKWHAQDGMRAPELRRHLIAYLRNHPEELAPYDLRRAKATGTAS